MANNPNNIKLSACRVRWGGRDLGLTKGGIDVTIKTTTKPINVDQFGATDVNEYITGRNITIKAPFAETDLDTFYTLTRQIGGVLTDNAGVAATGTITSLLVPTALSTLTVNGHVFTFVTAIASPFLPDQILIASAYTATAQAANIIAVLQQSTDPAVLQATYTQVAGVITVNFYRSGLDGNNFTLATSSPTTTSVGAATLTGGVSSIYRNVSLGTAVGTSLLATSLPLVLHPANLVDGDTTQDFTVPIANTPGNITFAYKFDNERVYMVDFEGYPNPSTNVLAIYGNTSPLV